VRADEICVKKMLYQAFALVASPVASHTCRAKHSWAFV